MARSKQLPCTFCGAENRPTRRVTPGGTGGPSRRVWRACSSCYQKAVNVRREAGERAAVENVIAAERMIRERN